LQALIALPKWSSWQHLELQSASVRQRLNGWLNEITQLTEHTIENLRRLTRAMRPVTGKTWEWFQHLRCRHVRPRGMDAA
jgi:hypothetical protein